MKKSKWVWTNIAVALGLIALTLFGGLGVQNYLRYREDTKKFRINADDIIWYSLDRNFNGYTGGDVDYLYCSFNSEDKDEIAALVECVKEVEKNNRIGKTDIEAAPRYYEFTVLEKEGGIKMYTYNTYYYTVYYTGKDYEMNDPFDAFFALPSVQEKLEKAREVYR